MTTEELKAQNAELNLKLELADAAAMSFLKLWSDLHRAVRDYVTAMADNDWEKGSASMESMLYELERGSDIAKNAAAIIEAKQNGAK